jgi:hypothetical protein
MLKKDNDDEFRAYAQGIVDGTTSV